jgi:hypothetical protein
MYAVHILHRGLMSDTALEPWHGLSVWSRTCVCRYKRYEEGAKEARMQQPPTVHVDGTTRPVEGQSAK